MTVAWTDAAAIRTGGLHGFDLVVHPGGSGSRQGKALGEEGRERVRRFVRDGGGMLGICAGAYLASADYDWSLHLLDAKVLDRAHWARGGGTVELGLSPEGRRLLGVPDDTREVRYNQGPLLAPAGDPDLPDYRTLAVFNTEVHKEGVPGGVMPGTTAVAAGEFGGGRGVCFSPHPESDAGNWRMLRRAAFWAAGRDPDRVDARPDRPVAVAGDLVHIERGTLPLVLSAPHGGRALVPGVPPRTKREGKPYDAKFVTVRDTRSDRLALLIADALETPHRPPAVGRAGEVRPPVHRRQPPARRGVRAPPRPARLRPVPPHPRRVRRRVEGPRRRPAGRPCTGRPERRTR